MQQSPQPKQTPPRALWRWLIVALLLAVLGLGGYRGVKEWLAVREWNASEKALFAADHDRALAHLEKYLAYWPDDPQVYLRLAQAERMAGHAAAVNKHLKAARAAGADTDAIELQTELLDAARGKLEAVEARLRRRLEANDPEKRQIRDVLIGAYLARGRAEDAERDATKWLDEAPDDWRPSFLRGFARTLLSRDLISTTFEEAKKDYERAVALNPDYPPTRLLLGNAYSKSGNWAAALPQQERYRQLKPDDPNGLAEYAHCLRNLARVEEAQWAVDDWLATHNPTLEVCLVRGQIALDTAKPADALNWFRRAETMAPNAEKVPFHLAEALRALGRADEAKTYEEKWRTRQELTTRLNDLAKTATNEPNNVMTRYEAGVVALKLGNDAAGRRWFFEALKLDQKHRPTNLALAEHFEKIGNAEAAAFHRKVAEQKP